MLEINKIHQGDCLEVMKQIKDKSVDMILCDLPYGTTNSKWDFPIDLNKLWMQYIRIIKKDGAIVLTAVQPFASKLTLSGIDWFKYEWIWEKTDSAGFFNAKNCPVKKHEQILVFSRGTVANGSKNLMKYYPQGLTPTKIKRKSNNNSGNSIIGKRPSRKDYIQTMTNYPTSILFFKNDKLKIHDVSKPVSLFEYLIKTYTNEGDLVLDNCIGSGTTAVACINTKRNFIGIELLEEYCKIAEDRIQKELSQTKLNSEVSIPPNPKG